MTPATYRKGGEGVRVAYTTADCSLGKLLVAATERGICAIYLGDDPVALESELLKEYPAAQVHRVEGQLQEWVGAVLERLDGRLDGQPPIQPLPMDVRATAFQRRDWQQLMTIPSGETRTYGQVAIELGCPQSARAVALLVPCHRVVRQDGGMGGYRWGTQRKETLLGRESAGS